MSWSTRQLSTLRPALAGAQRSRYLVGGLVFILLFMLYLGPRLYGHRPKDVLPLLPKPHESSRLHHQLSELIRNLAEVFENHGKTVPEPVFPIQALTSAQAHRYSALSSPKGSDQGIYMFTGITRQIQDQLPDLLAALTVVVDTLGSHAVGFSIVEGPSDDLTPYVLRDILRPHLIELGVPENHIRIETDSPKIDWDSDNRIAILASLRNQAMQPLYDGHFGTVRQVVFFNDVFLKAEHFLEMLYMHQANRADVSAAWDWYRRDPAWFYDVWVARSIESGDLFYPIDQAWWTPSEDILPDSPRSRSAYENLEPFQAFCAWNGMVVFNAEPFQGSQGLRFRKGLPEKGECPQAECSQMCSDLWELGRGKIQVVPSVQLGYERQVAIETEYRIQEDRAKLDWKDGVPPSAGRIGGTFRWTNRPPSKIRCNAWPEKNGLSANVWEKTEWVGPPRSKMIP